MPVLERSTATTPSAAASCRMRGREMPRFLAEAGRDLLGALEHLPGGSSLLRMPSFGGPTYLVRHPEHARQVLVTNQDAYVKGDDYRVLAWQLGNGLLTNLDRESWQRNRAIVQPLFAKRHLAPMASHMVAAAGDWLGALDARVGEGETIDISRAMMGLTLDVVGRALFGRGIDGPTTAAVGEAITVLLDGASASYDLLPLYQLLHERAGIPFEDTLRIRWRRWRRATVAKAELDAIVHAIIDARVAEGSAGDDLLSLLLTAQDERGETAMDRRQVRDEVMTFLGAGHETTANALTWMWMLLSLHPQARNRMQAEVDEVLGGRRPVYEDAERLVWTSAVLQESMRLFPPVPIITRVCAEQDEMAGRSIRAGSDMIVLTHLLHRDPEFWPNPEGFDPERFMPGAGEDRPRQSFMPFGAGRRICVGQGFALLEGVLLSAMIAQRLRFDLVPGARVRREFAVTLRPRDGMRMTVWRRSGDA
jgi:cytochrome P450